VYWVSDIGQRFRNWNHDGIVQDREFFPTWSTTFSASNGWYSSWCNAAAFTLFAYGQAGPLNRDYAGVGSKPAQYPGQTVTVDINAYRQN